MRRFVAVVVLLASLAVSGAALADSCGIPPIPPIPQIGCRDMQPVCVCDDEDECRWIFVCVPD